MNTSKFQRWLFIVPLIFNLSFAYSQQRGPEKWTARVHPNPTKGIIYIKLAGKYDELTHINVVNEVGQSVYTDNIENDRSHLIDLRFLAAGKYMVQMMSTNIYMKQPLLIIE